MAAIDALRSVEATMHGGLEGPVSPLPASGNQAGFTMLEILIAMILVAFGLLGLFGLQAKAQKAETESYERTQALVLIQDIADRMNANRTAAFSQAYVTASAVGGGGMLIDCSGKTGAELDLCEWGNLLKGSAETANGAACSTASAAGCVGAMLGASGCIAYDSTTELADSTGAVQAGTGIYTISVVWQGLSSTVIPSAQQTCVSTLSGARMVTSTLRIAALGAQ